MTAISFRPDELTTQLGPQGPIPNPIAGLPAPLARSKSIATEVATTRTGIWQCEPGRFNRSSLSGEWCYIIEGEATFEAADGKKHALSPGAALYIPCGSNGIWDIGKRITKVFVTFEE